MSTRFYMFLWLAAILATTGFYLAGSLTLLVGVVFGFIFFGLTFMGMISVLPTMVHAEVTTAHPVEKAARAHTKREQIAEEIRGFAAAWSENGVEVREVRAHWR